LRFTFGCDRIDRYLIYVLRRAKESLYLSVLPPCASDSRNFIGGFIMQDEKKAADAIAREARRTAAAGVIFAVLWTALGFGLAESEVTIAGFPLWAVTSTVGVLVVGTVLALYLAWAAEDVSLDAHGEGDVR
jgi:hypothetical protein